MNPKQQGDPEFDFGLPSGKEIDRDFAFYLEKAPPGDQRVIDTLVHSYGSEIFRLFWLTVWAERSVPPSREQALSFVAQVLRAAEANRADFIGRESVRVWVLGFAVRMIERRMRPRWGWIWLRTRPGEEIGDARPSPRRPWTPEQRRYWVAIGHLTFRTRLAVILRYGLGLTIPEIAQSMGATTEKIHQVLSRGRLFLVRKPPLSTDSLLPHIPFHKGPHRFIQAKLDGLQVGMRDNHQQLSQHLSSCKSCRTEQRIFEGLERDLKQVLRAFSPGVSIDFADLLSQIGTDQPRLDSWVFRRLFSRIKEIGIYAVVIISVIAAFYVLSSSETARPLPIGYPTPDSLLQPLVASPERVIRIANGRSGVTFDRSKILFGEEPSISADGRYVAFTSSLDTLVQGDLNAAADVFVWDRLTNHFERISIASDGTEGEDWSYRPAISADGRTVAFTSRASNLIAGDVASCQSESAAQSCAEVYIHDRSTGVTERIVEDRGIHHAHGFSDFPAISADGRYVAFWSSDSHLADNDESLERCDSDQATDICLDVFIYDRITGIYERIPIGRDHEELTAGPPSLSANGRYLAITLHARDQIAQSLDFPNQEDVFVYDRRVGKFEAINVAVDGSPAKGSSFSAHITADGRFVVFGSLADNLVPGDRDGRADVFIRDRVLQTTELVSRSTSGTKGNAGSGRQGIPGILGWGEQIGVSDDGRFVAFSSNADNLAPRESGPCYHAGKTICRSVFVRDRLQGSTTLVYPGSGRDSYYQSVHISGDGRWVSVVEKFLRCSEAELCSELWVFDLQTGELINPLRATFSEDRTSPTRWPDLTFVQKSSVTSVAFSPDGSILASGANDAVVRLWRIDSGDLEKILAGHSQPISALAFAPDGELLFSSSFDGRVNIWRVKDGALVSRLFENAGAIYDLALSPDGRMLVAGGVGKVWTFEVLKTGVYLVESKLIPAGTVHALSFSPDGSLLAIAMSDGTIWLRNMDSGELVLRLGGHLGKAITVAISPDGRYLATGSQDGLLHLWALTLNTGEKLEARLLVAIHHTNWVNQVAFSQDGTNLASVSLDGTIHRWLIPNGDEVSIAFKVRRDELISLAFSPDGLSLAAGTIRGHIDIWSLRVR